MTSGRPAGVIDPATARLGRTHDDVVEHLQVLASYQSCDGHVRKGSGDAYEDVDPREVCEAIALVGEVQVDGIIVLSAERCGRSNDLIMVRGIRHSVSNKSTFVARASDGALVSGPTTSSVRKALRHYETVDRGADPWSGLTERFLQRPEWLTEFWPTDLRTTVEREVIRFAGIATVEGPWGPTRQQQAVYVAQTSDGQIVGTASRDGRPSPFSAEITATLLRSHEQALASWNVFPEDDLDAIAAIG